MNDKIKYNDDSNFANIDTNKAVYKQRDYYIVKHNDLIQKQVFKVDEEIYSVKKENYKSMSVIEQKIFLYIISKIKPDETELREVKFNIQRFCKVIGIKDKGNNYINLKRAIAKLMSNVIILKKGKKTLMINLIHATTIDESGGTIYIKLHEKLKPYILNLQNNYTQYTLKNVLGFKSKYSFILYEYLKSQQFKKRINIFSISLEELKKRLDCENYNNFTNFVNKALQPAIKEINLYTDLEVSVNLIKEGRTYNTVEFYIKQLDFEHEEKELIHRISRTDKKIEPDKKTMFEDYYHEDL